ncbi:hypothetical protein [Buttiauxella sp. S19-1]|uniref:hypothetical protein n=1 Tax=Buttiauxella sp. S19-1 TaxID=941430 RepID=UPI001ED9DCDA|nr:hypothetical protein [Buttiauxella sp. S19-1]
MSDRYSVDILGWEIIATPLPQGIGVKRHLNVQQRAITAMSAHSKTPHGYAEYYATLRAAENTAARLSLILSTRGKRSYDAAARAATAHYMDLAMNMPESYQRHCLINSSLFYPKRSSAADRDELSTITATITDTIERYRRDGLSSNMERAAMGVIASIESGQFTDDIYHIFANEAAGLIADHYRPGLPLEAPQIIAARSIWHNTPAAFPITMLIIQRAKMYRPETDEKGNITELNPLTQPRDCQLY